MKPRTKSGSLVMATSLILLLSGVPDATAMPGLDRISVESVLSSQSPKTISAFCPPGKRVIGGGGLAFAPSPADEKKVALTRLEPVVSVIQDSYTVTATEMAPGIGADWKVQAFAICANPPAGYELATGTTAPSSNGTQQIAALCSGGKKVFGTGARINNPGGEVTLHLTRSDGPRSIGRVTAKEDAGGYSGTWNVTAFAVCANDRDGFVIASNGSVQTGSEDAKFAAVDCPPGTFVHNTAVASSGRPPALDSTPPGVAVQMLQPVTGLRRAEVFAVETTPTNASWDVGIFAICGP